MNGREINITIVVNMECSIKDENTFIKTLQFFFTLISIIEDVKLLADMEYLTQFKYTGNLEVYHSVINKYSPKRLHFSLYGMIARTQLAVMDFNSGADDKQNKMVLFTSNRFSPR